MNKEQNQVYLEYTLEQAFLSDDPRYKKVNLDATHKVFGRDFSKSEIVSLVDKILDGHDCRKEACSVCIKKAEFLGEPVN